MKKLLLLIVSVLCPYIDMVAEGFQSPSQESHEIKLEKLPPIEGSGELGFPRSTYFLKANYSSSIREIELIHDNLKNTDVYLLDASGNVLYHMHIYTLNYSIDSIPLPSINGVYTLVIDSEVVYAYGILDIQ